MSIVSLGNTLCLIFFIIKSMHKSPAERDYQPDRFGATNLSNLNTRMFDKSRGLQKSNSREQFYRSQQSFSDSSSESNVNLSAILNTGEVFP